MDKTLATRESSLECPPAQCHLFGCFTHKIGFAMNKSGKIFNNAQLRQIAWKPSSEISHIVKSCQKDSDFCRFYFKTTTKHVYEWIINIDDENLRKRVKLNNTYAERVAAQNVTMIAENIDHILPMDKPGVALFSGTAVQYYNPENELLESTSLYNPLDTNFTCQQFTNQLNSCLKDFFSIPSLVFGLVFGTKEGSVYIRDFGADVTKDIKILTFEGSEQVKFIDVLNIPNLSKDHNAIVVFGDQGTIMVYSEASTTETSVAFNQFNVQGPILSVDKASGDSAYLIASGSGYVTHLNLKITLNSVELDSNIVTPVYNNVKKIKVIDFESNTFESIRDNNGTAFYSTKCEYNLTPEIKGPQEIKIAIEQALAQLELSESEVKKLDEEEQKLNKKLTSVNKTLYALRSINHKRKLGVVNSLESTGFEFSVCPINTRQSIANSSLHCSSFLRVCIKTSRFLELEEWDLQLEFSPKQMSTTRNTTRQIKSVSVMGFEPHFENGIERYSIWERDIEIDLDKIRLPVEISAILVMSINESESPPLLFPVTKIAIDDLHFAVPCSSDLILGIERRGLEDISNRLMESFNKQRLSDKTGKYAFSRLINSKRHSNEKPPSKLFDQREIHIQCTVDMHMTNDNYRSILSRLLNEGRTMEDMKSILTNAEHAIFTLAAFPGCPVIIKLTRVSSTLIDICVQCVYLPALFKVEATVLARLFQYFVKDPMPDKKDSTLKRLRTLEEKILDIQDKYQNSENQMDIDEDETFTEQSKNAIDALYSIHHDNPIGHLAINVGE